MKANFAVPLALACTIAFAAPATAAEPAQINVALLDMSSLMSPGPGPGANMMGGGWGMMGGGPGMMGMGGMTVRADQATVKAGTVHFNVTNWSRAILHEMLVVAVDKADAPLPYDYNLAKVPEDQVKSLGEVGELQPNQSGTLDVALAPGTYLLLCNVPGHYASGMWTALTVTE